MEENKQNNSVKEMTLKELFSSPQFYLAIFPHIFSLFLIFSNGLGYILAFSIFYLELVIDIFIVSFSVLFMKTEKVQKMYKSTWPKLFLAFRSFLSGLFICLFCGLFTIVFILGTENISVKEILFNKVVLLALGVYVTSKLFGFVINIFNNEFGSYNEAVLGRSLVVNLFALIIFTVPGIHILLFLNLFIENIQAIAIVLLFTVKAFLDSTLSVALNKNHGT